MLQPLNSLPSTAIPGGTGHDSDAPLSLLRMSVGDEALAVSIDDVREILQVARLTPLPRTPDFVRGVMNLRGAVVPVIDLSARLGGPATVTGRRSCIVVVDATDAVPANAAGNDPDGPGQPFTVGLLVDAVYEVFDRAAHEVESAPALGTRVAPGFLRGITRSGGQLIGVLALQHVLAADELSNAIAAWRTH
ncbi:MAG: chemotaxis protein CheW [Betaproteobacteria bacterium]|jgi:purine-binding chemotaxis protein CheW|nr:chemotaxis protein CheW [Rubrivivax sp.]